MADRLAQRLGIVGVIAPQNLTTASTVGTSAAIDMSTCDKVLVTLLIGAQTGTVGISLQAATSTSGADFAAFSTPVQATGLTGSNIQQTLEIDAIKMPAGKRYLNAKVTGNNTSTNVSPVSVIIQAEPRYNPAPNISGVQTAVNA